MSRVAVLLGACLVACGGNAGGCADVIGVSIAEVGSDTFSVAATIESSDVGWEKYADRFEVRGPEGAVLGELVLTHPHVDEQPFTRTLANVTIPAGVADVGVAAHDSVEGFCGAVFHVGVPGR